MINESTDDQRFIFITPYKTEIERVLQSCSSKDFHTPPELRYPKDYFKGQSKLEYLHKLLGNKKNIASTHSLFMRSNDETKRLIAEGGYTLVLDEVLDIFQSVNFSKGDMTMLLEKGIIKRDPMGIVVWDYNYEGDTFRPLIERAEQHDLITSNDQDFFWMFPMDIFNCFKETYLLTYMFYHQPIRVCLEAAKIEYELIGCRKNERDEYELCNANEVDRSIDLRPLIEVVDNTKRNSLGNDRTALSMEWYKKNIRSQSGLIDKLKTQITNSVRSDMTDDGGVMWTTFTKFKSTMRGKGYSKGYITFNQRATNKYKDCTKIVYAVNVFMNPNLLRFLNRIGNEPIDQDMWALSSLIQYMFRSALRDGKKIKIYIPSLRMRKLLEFWLDNLALGNDLQPINLKYTVGRDRSFVFYGGVTIPEEHRKHNKQETSIN